MLHVYENCCSSHIWWYTQVHPCWYIIEWTLLLLLLLLNWLLNQHFSTNEAINQRSYREKKKLSHLKYRVSYIFPLSTHTENKYTHVFIQWENTHTHLQRVSHSSSIVFYFYLVTYGIFIIRPSYHFYCTCFLYTLLCDIFISWLLLLLLPLLMVGVVIVLVIEEQINKQTNKPKKERTNTQQKTYLVLF